MVFQAYDETYKKDFVKLKKNKKCFCSIPSFFLLCFIIIIYILFVIVSGTEIRSSNNCGANDNADIDHDAAGSFTPTETEDFAKETPELAHVMQNNFERHEQAAGTKSNTIESVSILASLGCYSSPDPSMRLEDHSNCAFPESSCSVLNFLLLNAFCPGKNK